MTDKIRAEFEKSIAEIPWFGVGDWSFVRYEDGYMDCEIHSAWLAWQASRAALVVDVSSITSSSFLQEKVKQKLDAAGVAYK